MKKILIYILAVFFLLYLPLSAEEKAGSVPDHDRVADDLKFNNGRQFLALRHPAKAREELEEYLEIFHNGNHRAEAWLILADIAYNNFRYQKALKTYRSLYEEFSNTETGAEALFKMGLCYRKMGFDNRAINTFTLLVADHPTSTFASQARMHIDLVKILEKK